MTGNPDAWKRYRKTTTKTMGLTLNKNTDADVIEWLERQPNRAAYLKRIIREDIARNDK